MHENKMHTLSTASAFHTKVQNIMW